MVEKLHIVYATDDGYMMPTLVAAASALEAASDRSQIKIIVLDVGISDERWRDFEARLRKLYGKTFELVRHVVDISIYEEFKTYQGSLGTYARLDIPQILANVSWCVYCDGDTLFLDDPLKLRGVYDDRYALHGQDDRENWNLVGAVPEKELWAKRNGLSWDLSQYVCAGFLLMNLDWFRANKGTERCLDFLRKYPDCKNHDQDALSYVCQTAIKRLPDAWGRLSRNAFRSPRPCCLHYAADAPWKLLDSRRPDYNDAHKLWFDFVRFRFGWSMQDVLSTPFSLVSFTRKVIFRMVFKTAFWLANLVGGPNRVIRTLERHYTFHKEFVHMVGCRT